MAINNPEYVKFLCQPRYKFTGRCERLSPPRRGSTAVTSSDSSFVLGVAIRKYQDFVLRGVGKGLWPEVKQLIYLGSDSFASEMQSKMFSLELLSEIPAKQKRLPAKPLDCCMWSKHRRQKQDYSISLRQLSISSDRVKPLFWLTLWNS